TTPGIEPSVLTVGAMTTWGTDARSDDTVALYSSKGPTIDQFVKPDIAAPGSHVVAPAAAGSYLITTHPELAVGTQYLQLSGTSMASPVTAGAVALMLSAKPGLTPNAVKLLLMYTAERRGELLGTGAGEINIA